MVEKKQKNFLTVPPFECLWCDDLRFREAGRGCVAFDAYACNDVTVVFREQVGSQHYHYKTDKSPHYTVIIGSNRNRRLKIEVDGKIVIDEAGSGLCCSSAFQSYWISFCDGLISIGKGRYPFQNLAFKWLDTNPNCSVQYVGFSSWDTHVGYRNISVLPLTQNHISLWKRIDYGKCDCEEGEEETGYRSGGYDDWGLDIFLETWELSDIFFIIGEEKRVVPAHKIILAVSGNFGIKSDEDAIKLKDVTYPVLHSLLQFIYTGRTRVSESELSSLRSLSLHFEVNTLVKQCEEIIERFKLNRRLFDSGTNIEISSPNSWQHCGTTFPFGLPVNKQRLKHFYKNGDHSDLKIKIEGSDLFFQSHKVILCLWSVPFMKMLTNGMSESTSSEICLNDVSLEAFKIMIKFMYTGELHKEDRIDIAILLQLLLLADQFGVSLLHQECCKTLLECLSEIDTKKKSKEVLQVWTCETKKRPVLNFGVLDIDTSHLHIICRNGVPFWKDLVCPILQVVSSISSCKLIEETCKRKFAMHFDYCTTASIDFVLLDDHTFTSILQHPDLTVISEDKVLIAILMWCLRAKEFCGWEVIEEIISNATIEVRFGDRHHSFNELLSLVRFPLLSHSLLKKLERSKLSMAAPRFAHLVKEAISFLEIGQASPEKDIKFQHRRSSFRELQYICDGDSNGVLYFAGTSYGDHHWVNPVLSKRIAITASSPVSRYTDPKVLVARTYQGTSFAGPLVEDGRVSSWWMIDIGKDHQLICNYYTLRQDGSRTFIRSWNFEGSADGKIWTNLRVHKNDQTLCKPAQYASWPVNGSSALLPFRFFRVNLTAPTSDDANPWSFCICFLELYGYLH